MISNKTKATIKDLHRWLIHTPRLSQKFKEESCEALEELRCSWLVENVERMKERKIMRQDKREENYGTFGWAIEEMRQERIVFRTNVSSSEIGEEFIFLRRGRSIENVSGPMKDYAGLETFKSFSHFCKKIQQSELIVGWLPSAEEILATDWESE